MNSVPFLDLKAQNDALRPEIDGAIKRVLDSGHFILGPEVTSFESEIAAWLGVEHAVGVSSGTDALLVALMAAEVGPGDEVITTPFSFFATAGTVHRLGATPVFVDIEPDTFNLDAALVEAAITKRTKAILPVHLFGQCANMSALTGVARERRISVVEDAAQAIGASTPLGPAGGMGAMGCFSFFPSKNLGALGDGGLVTTRDGELAEKIRILRAHGSKPKYFHHVVGGNFRLDSLQAAVLRTKLPHLHEWTRTRRRNAAKYDELFGQAGLPTAKLVTPEAVEGHIYNQYVIRTTERDELKEHLRQEGIGSAVYYPKALHLQACFESLGYKPGSMPQAERACGEVLALPIFPELGDARLERVASAVLGYLTGA